jgi:pseudoazurin
MLRLTTFAAALALFAAGAAHANEVEVKTLNFGKGGMMVLEPALVRIAPGDSVHFVAKDKGHNVESIPGMLPDGAEPFEGKMNQDITVTFDKPGVYGIRCKPHYPMGMVGLIVVGEPTNIDAAKAVPQTGKAAKTFATLFDTLAAQKTASK